MDMGIDHPRQHEPPIGVEHLIGGFGGIRVENCRYPAVPHIDIGATAAGGGHHRPASDYEIERHFGCRIQPP